MADNSPTSWPPAPETGANQTAKKPANKAVGWVSLALAVFLFVVELFTLLALFYAGDWAKILGVFFRLSAGLLGLWIGAIVSGITGRRSLPGKLGIAVSVIDLVLYGWLLYQYQDLTDLTF